MSENSQLPVAVSPADGRAADRRMRQTLGVMLGNLPFFANLAMHVPLVRHPKVKSVACDGENLYYSADWVLDSEADRIKAAVSRVVMACALKHHTRRGERKYKKWQQASKAVTLPILRAAGLTDETGGMDMSVEEAYEALPDTDDDDDEDGEDNVGGAGGMGLPVAGPSGGPPSHDPDGKGEVLDAPPPPQPQDGDGSGEGNGQGAGGGSRLSEAAARQEQEQKWDDRMHQAAQMSKQAGFMPGGLAELIGEAHSERVDWRVLLERFMAQVSANDYSWRRPNRRFLAQGFYLPSLRDECMGPVVVAVDTSGSMGEEELATAWAETRSAVQAVRPERVTVVQCDAAIQSVEDYAPDDLDAVEFEAKGRGGTMVRPVFDLVDDMREPPAAVVYFSDMEVWEWGDEPDYPVLWVRPVTGDHAPAPPPWGEYVEARA